RIARGRAACAARPGDKDGRATEEGKERNEKECTQRKTSTHDTARRSGPDAAESRILALASFASFGSFTSFASFTSFTSFASSVLRRPPAWRPLFPVAPLS